MCPHVLCLARVRIAGVSHLRISHSRSAQLESWRTAPGQMWFRKHLRKSSDAGFHNCVISQIPSAWRRTGWAVHPFSMALLCLVARTFNTARVQPGPLQGIQFQFIAAARQGPVWSFPAPLQQVLKLEEEVCCPKDTGLHGWCPPGGWIRE